jgi:hypothetical protein
MIIIPFSVEKVNSPAGSLPLPSVCPLALPLNLTYIVIVLLILTLGNLPYTNF